MTALAPKDFLSMLEIAEYCVHRPHHMYVPRVHAIRSRQALHHREIEASAKRRKGQDRNKTSNDGTQVEDPDETASQLSRSGKKMGWKILPREEDEINTTMQSTQEAREEVLYPFQEATDVALDQEELPPVSRGRVFAACLQTSAVLVAFALLLRTRAAALSAAVLHTDPAEVNRLLSFNGEIELSHVAIALACAATISGARLLLLERWPAFAEATNRSNKQVLQNLAPVDLLWVSFLPGISEELLFRGALIPSLYPDWRGVLIAGLGFGILHNSGGRNWSFAGWASIVGIVYGIVFVQTQDIFVPVAAHSLANLVSASFWLKLRNKKGR